MLFRAKFKGFRTEHWVELKALVWKHASKFRATFFAKPAKVDSMQFKLKPDAQPVQVKRRNYSIKQRQFFHSMVMDLSEHELVYANHTSPYASVPLLGLKPCPPPWRFTVDLSSVKNLPSVTSISCLFSSTSSQR